MTRIVSLHVQVDRLPDVGTKRQVGVRVSAAIQPGGEDRAKPEDIAYLLPWAWSDGAGAAWNPEDKGGWRVFSIDKGVPSTIVAFTPVNLETLGTPDGLTTKIDERARAFDPSRMEAPQGEVTGPTLFGHVESLTGLPHPYPATLKVWTCIELPATADEADAKREIVTLPVFGPEKTTGQYVPDITDGTALDPVLDEGGNPVAGAWRIPYRIEAAVDVLLDMTADVRTALPLSKADGAQIIDTATFTIRTAKANGAAEDRDGGWTTAADEDWVSALPDRFAEALDPVARLASALDSVVQQKINDSVKPDDAKELLKVLRDRTNRDALLRLLDAAAWRVVAPATVGAPLIPPPASLLSVLPAGDTIEAVRARLAAQVVLAALSDRDASAAGADCRPDAAAPASFRLRSRRNLALLVGLSREETAHEAAEDEDKKTRPVEIEAEFRTWLFRHWLDKAESGGERPLEVAAVREIAVSREVEWTPAQTFSLKTVPLLNLARLGESIEIPFHVRVADPAVASELTVAFRIFSVPDSSKDDKALAVRAFALRIERGQMTVDGKEPKPVDAAARVDLTVRFAPAVDGIKLSVSASQGEQATSFIEIGNAFSATLGRGAIRLQATEGGFANVSARVPKTAARALQPYQDKSVPTGALRLAVSRAFAGAYLPLVLAGEVPGGSSDSDPRRRIVDGFRALVPLRYAALRQSALEAVARTGDNIAPVTGIFEDIVNRAAADALARTPTLVPAAQVGRRITQRAAPIVLPIDQLQAFPEGEDLWERFAGVGALIGRSKEPDEDFPDDGEWWSLNVADLHVPGVDVSGARGELKADNWVRRVDPVPMQIAETGGVRAATLTYESRSIVGEMPSDPRHAQKEGIAAISARRIEAYGFPKALVLKDTTLDSVKLPPLSCGKTFFVFPYLLGHGGALPPLLRLDPGDPVKPRWVPGETRIPIPPKVFDDHGARKDIRKIACLRTTPIGAPRLDEKSSTLPGVPEGVTPLAGELPITPSPVTLAAGEEAHFYLDREGLGGVLDFAFAEPARRALSIDLAGAGLPAGSVLTLRIRGAGARAGLPLEILFAVDIESRHWAVGTTGLRLTFGKLGVGIFREASRDGLLPDEPSRFEFVEAASDPLVKIGDWASFAVTLTATADLDVVPSIVAFGSRQGGDSPAATPPDEQDLIVFDAVPQLPPESAHQQRMIAILDGIGPDNPSPAKLRLRRPATDFGTYAQWINWALPQTIKDRLDQEHKHQTKPRSPSDRDDTTIDDPAVSGLAVELVEIFPDRKLHGLRIVARSKLDALADVIAPRPQGTDFLIKIMATGSASIDDSSVTVLPGRIYELRIYGAMPQRQDEIADGIACSARIAPPVRHVMRRIAHGEAYLLGAPLTLTLEVATMAMPPLEKAGKDLLRVKEQRGRGDQTDDLALVKLDWETLVGMDGLTRESAYVSLRHVDRVGLFSQRWSWRGRPHPDEFWKGEQNTALDQLLFLGRRDDDVGVILERRLERAHLFGDIGNDRPPIVVKDLQYRGGANRWRFGLRATSRYSALRPNSASLVRFSHRDPTRAEPSWQKLILKDRPTGRVPKRPPLSIVLPLTEPFMADGAVPPLLAIFAEPMFQNFHVGDGLEATLDYVRHPLPSAEVVAAAAAAAPESAPAAQGPKQRYWPQIGPDPILTGEGHKGEPVPIRLDGPLGYTFDIDTEAPRFNHSGYLVSLVSSSVQSLSPSIPPWSFVKLRFRRLEAPELLQANEVAPEAGVGYAIASATEDPPDARGGLRYFGTVHDGIVLDLVQVPEPGELTLRVAPPPVTRNPTDRNLIVSWGVVRGTLTIAFNTELGGAGTWEAALPSSGDIRLRLVIAERDRPQEGENLYTPVLDVSLRALIRREDEGLVREHENAWITVACLPLAAGDKFLPQEPVGIRFESQGKVPGLLKPIRLSSFTPALWCQFAQHFSRLRIEVEGEPDPVEVRHNDIAARISGDWELTFEWTDQQGVRRKVKRLLPFVKSDSGAQVEFALAVVVTRYVYDAFDRLREIPMCVFDRAPGNKPVWTNLDDRSAPAGKSGRIRFLTLQRLMGKIDERDRSFPSGFFQEVTDEAVEMDPQDATGRLLGVSKPIEWG